MSDLEVCEWSDNRLESLPSTKWSDVEDNSFDSLPVTQWSNCEIVEDSDVENLSDNLPTSTPKKLVKSKSMIVPFRPPKRCISQDENDIDIGNWSLSKVLGTAGCKENCATEVHGLTVLDILCAHSQFTSKSTQEQNEWILSYISSHSPYDANGIPDVKGVTFIIAGSNVCLDIWLSILSLSTSRYYRLRKEVIRNGGYTPPQLKRSRSVSSKTMLATAWMEQYFERIGDKRPDKNGIYLPTCLTERKIYEIMIGELCQGDETQCICFSQFNKLYREEFKHVAIPKVSKFFLMYVAKFISLHI